jgi:anti-anti-sigma factor
LPVIYASDTEILFKLISRIITQALVTDITDKAPVIRQKFKNKIQYSNKCSKTSGILSPPRRWRGQEQFHHRFPGCYIFQEFLMLLTIEKKDNVSYVNISGDFFLGNVIEFENEWDNITQDNPSAVAVNCGLITSLDSTALGSIVNFLKYLEKKKIKLILYDLTSQMTSLFKTSMLDKFFIITTSSKMESALDTISNP